MIPRITPACAGNSVLQSVFFKVHRDHPRLRGEQNCCFPHICPFTGSPPLARGTVLPKRTGAYASLITPACAGNSYQKEFDQDAKRDHPRLRGEQAIPHLVRLAAVGSPPLARGTGTATAGWSLYFGITPACAGNSYTSNINPHLGQDHPRLRGEQTIPRAIPPYALGSPPLARGTALRHDNAILLAGITPACAGNRQKARRKCHEKWDHPRLRGEQASCPRPPVPSKGSPPLARGTEPVEYPGITPFGITPACAGNS